MYNILWHQVIKEEKKKQIKNRECMANNGFIAFAAVREFSLDWCTSKVERGRERA